MSNVNGSGRKDRALYKAAKSGDHKRLRKLIRAGADVNTNNKYGYPALIRAVQNGHDRCVEVLLRAGADVNTSHHLNTALMIATKCGFDKCVESFLKAGADVNEEGGSFDETTAYRSR